MRKVKALVDGVPLAFVHVGVALKVGSVFEVQDADAEAMASVGLVEILKGGDKAKATTAEKE